MTSSLVRNPWLPWATHHTKASLRLFCLPYAGGGPVAFRNWAGLLPENIDVLPVELPGHGTRLREPAYTRLAALVEALVPVLEPWLDCPFAIYGHSLGGLLGFELAHALRQRGHQPMHLFVSGVVAPHRPDPNPKIHHLTDPAFLEEMKLLGGMPREVMECRELLEMILPALRADFAMLETHEHHLQPPLECPITVFGGHDDPRASLADMEPWRELTRAECSLIMLPGGHFFIDLHQHALLSDIGVRLREILNAAINMPPRSPGEFSCA